MCDSELSVIRAGLSFIQGGPSGSLGIDPASLGNLELYLKSDSADINALANGATVHTWADQSGHNRGIFGIYNGTPKKVSAASPKGLAMISIGNNTGMAGTDFGPQGTVDTTKGITLYVYYSQDSLPFGALEWLVEWPQTPQALTTWAMDENGTMSYAARAGNPATDLIDGLASTGFHVMAIRCTPPRGAGGILQMMIDGSFVPGSQPQNAGLQGPYEVGCSTGGNLSLTGKVGAVIAYSTAHSDSVMAGVTKFIRGHWG